MGVLYQLIVQKSVRIDRLWVRQVLKKVLLVNFMVRRSIPKSEPMLGNKIYIPYIF